MSSFFTPIPVQHVKSLNKHAALDLIRFTPGGISRVELAQRMSLTRAAVTTIVSDFIANGIIREAESRIATSGRPPIILEIRSERGYVAGIDIGATHLTAIIANFGTHVIEEKEIPFDISKGPEKCIEQADALLNELLVSAKLQLEDLMAIGVGVPGPIVAEEGMVLAPPIMPGWDRFPILATLEKIWKRPISLNNDAELGALGEWACGAGRSQENLAYIKVGTGIGAGILINGQIYSGSTGSAGEIGHLTIDENGPQCTCGNRGCLEAVAGGKAIARQAQEALLNGQRTQLDSILPRENVSARDVAAAARRGDLLSQQILVQAGSHLGVAIAGLVNLFNPGMVIVGGGVAQIGDLFLEPVRKAVQKRSLPAAAQAVRITTALLGRRSSCMGAIVQAISIALHQIAEGKTSDVTLGTTQSQLAHV